MAEEEKQIDAKQKVVICGGGNAAHVFFGFSASDKNNDVYCDEKGGDLYVPDFKYRYLSQDIPYGLIVIKGIALLLKQVPQTPNIDKIICWAQGVMNKEYLVYGDDGTVVVGRDIQETRAPQKYNFSDIQQLL